MYVRDVMLSLSSPCSMLLLRLVSAKVIVTFIIFMTNLLTRGFQAYKKGQKRRWPQKSLNFRREQNLQSHFCGPSTLT